MKFVLFDEDLESSHLWKSAYGRNKSNDGKCLVDTLLMEREAILKLSLGDPLPTSHKKAEDVTDDDFAVFFFNLL
jgi:hypothetical protein